MGRRKPTGRPINGWLVIDKAAGHDLDPCRERGQAPDPGAEGRPRRHARPAGHRRAADRHGRGHQDRGLRHGRSGRPTSSRCASARRATPTMPQVRSPRPASCGRRDDEIRAALPQFVGLIQQVPPQYAAVKVQGERAYDIARRGETVELAPREIRIDELELVGRPDLDHARIPHDLRQGRLCARDRP